MKSRRRRSPSSRASNNDVKQFAQEIIKDHSKFIDKLKPFAGQYANLASENGQGNGGQGSGGQTTGGQSNAGQGNGAQLNGQLRTAGRNLQGNGGDGIDWVQLNEQLGDKCRESVRSELESKQGEAFDRCYVGQQVGAHTFMLDALQVFQQHASPQLKSVLAEGEQTTRDHLKKAKDLMQQLENGREQSQASRTNRNKRTQ